MIYRRSFCAESLRNSLVLLLVLGGLTAMIGMGQLLNSQLGLPAFAVLNLLALQLVKILPQLLTVAMFAGLVMTFNRMAQGRELLAWHAFGVRSRDWQLAIMFVAVPMAATIAVLALHGAPWSIRFADQYQQTLAREAKLENSAPGLFSEIRDNNLVFHIDALSPDRQLALGIFIFRESAPDVFEVMLADQADTDIGAAGLRSLQLDRGQSSRLDFNRQESLRISFAAADVQLGGQNARTDSRLRAQALADLGDTAAARAEYWWRMAFPLTALLLAVMALPLGRLSPGSGRGYQVMLAVLFYWLFYALCGLAKDLGEDGTLAAAVAAFAPQALLAPVVAAMLVLVRRHR